MAIGIKKSHKGRLHQALGVPDNKKISMQKLHKAAHSNDPHMRQMANFAINAHGFKHK